MANIVEQITDSLTSIVSTELGSDWEQMQRFYTPEENNMRNAKFAFAVRQLAAFVTEGITKNYTLDQGFEIMLMRFAVDRLSDADKLSKINELYDKADDLFKEILDTKIGLSSIVLIVNDPALAEPELLENGAVLLRVSINVRYRQQTF